MGRLPKCLKDYTCCQSDKNNMNSILESVSGHERLKKNVLNALLNKKKDKNQVNNNLMSLEDYYSNKSLIYEKYSASEVKLEENKFKLKYFATYVIDMARIFQRQMKEKAKNKDSNNVK
jgi:hypothetical protein